MAMALLAAGRGRGTVSNPALDAGSITATPGDTEVTISTSVAPSGGTAPYTKNLYRSTSGGSKGSEIAAAVTLPYDDTGRTNGVEYFYTLEVDDSAAGTDDTAQVSATPSAGGAALDFFADWSAATGTGSTAITDGGKMPERTSSPEAGTSPEVVDATGFGVPMANLFRHQFFGGAGGGVWGLEGAVSPGWAAPEIGQTQRRRFYFGNYVANGQTIGGDHGLQCNIGNIPWGFHLYGPGDNGLAAGEYHFGPFSWGNSGDGQWSSANGPLYAEFTRATMYRFEIQMDRVSSSVMDMKINVYNDNVSTTVPYRTSADFYYLDVPSETLADNTMVGIGSGGSSSDNAYRGWLVGISGQGGATNATGSFYFGGFAVRNNSAEEIGPYPVAEEAA